MLPPKIPVISKSASNKNCLELNLLQKNQWAQCLPHPGLKLGGYKHLCFWNVTMLWNEKIHFRAECCENYRLQQKILQIKVVQIKFPTKKLTGAYVYLLPGVKLGDLKDYHVWNITMYWNWKKTSSSTPGGDRQMYPPTDFFVGLILNSFCLKHFSI